MRDKLISDRLILGITNKLMRQDDKIDLAKAVYICRCMEAMEHQRKVLNNTEHAEVSKVDVKSKQQRTRRKHTDSTHLSHSAGARHGASVKSTCKCKFCAKVHHMKKELGTHATCVRDITISK